MSSVLRFDEWQDSNGVPRNAVIAVKDVLKTDTEVFGSVATGDDRAVTDLSITHEVSDPANKLIISAFLGATGSSSGLGNVGIAVHDGTGLIAIGEAAGNRPRVTQGGLIAVNAGTVGNRVVSMPSVTFVHTPGAGSKTYTFRVINIDTGTETLYINRSEGDNDSAGGSRAVSSLVIQEVAV